MQTPLFKKTGSFSNRVNGTPRPPRRFRIRLLSFALVTALAGYGAGASAATATWIGGTSNWNAGTNWSGGVVPDNNGTLFDVVIDNVPGTNSLVNLDTNATIDSLTVDSGDTLNLQNSRDLTLSSTALAGFVVNNGLIALSSSNFSTALTELILGGTISLSGSGEIVLNNDANNVVRTDGTTLTHGANHTIRGAGQLLNGTGSMVNDGTILQQGTTSLVIKPDSGDFTNNNVLRAEGSGGLELSGASGGEFTNNSTIEAADGSDVFLRDGAVINGGTLSASGSGNINLEDAGTAGPTLNQVALQGDGSADVLQGNNVDAVVIGGITNDAQWQINSSNFSTADTDVTFQGSQILGGSGEIVLNNDVDNRILTSIGDTLTQAASHTIRGAGALLAGTGSIINDGTIIQQGTNLLTIRPDAGDFTNNNVLRAEGSGGLELSGTSGGEFINNTTIEAADGSDIFLRDGVVVTGGILSAAGSGNVNLEGAGAAGATLNQVTLQGDGSADVLQGSNVDAVVIGGITNDAQWQVNSSNFNTSDTDITFQGSQTLGGNGEIVFNNDVDNRILTSTGDTLTQAASHTIRGAGELLAGTGSMINHGTIIQQGTNNLVVRPDSGNFVNNSVVRAEGSGGIELSGISGGEFINTGQSIDIDDGSVVDLTNSAIVRGGTFQATGTTGRVDFNGTGATGATLDGVTLNADAVQASNIDVTVLNSITNNATWSVNSSNFNVQDTDITFQGTQSLDGSGTIVFNNDVDNRILTGASDVLTHAGTHTIRGAGELLAGTGSMINQGTIIQEGTNRLLIDSGNTLTGFTNQGTLQATGSGGIEISGLTGGDFINTGQSLDIADGSVVDLTNSAIVRGGTFQATGTTGRLDFNGTGATGATLDGVTLNADAVQASNIDVTVLNGITNNATWSVNSSNFNTSDTDITFQGTQSLDGSGTIVFNNDVNNRILTGTSDILTHAGTHTIRGAGELLAGTGSMINQGTIIQEGTARLLIDPGSTATAFTNQGTLQATGTGGIEISGAGGGDFINTGQSLDIADGSVVDLTNSAIVRGGTFQATGTTGRVDFNGTGATGATLDGVTLNADAVQATNIDVTVLNGVTNNATWSVNSSNFNTSDTDITFQGSQTLGGTGEIALNNDQDNRILTGAGETLTQGSGHTIRGSGQLLDSTGGMINQGTVLGNQSSHLVVNPGAGSTFDNQGVVEARGGGTVAFIDSAEVANVSGTTLNGGTWNVIQDGGGITRINLGSGGTLADIQTNNANITLSGASSQFDALANLASNQGDFNLAATRDFNTVGNFANSGNLSISDAGTRLDVNGDFTQTAGNTNLAGGTLSGTNVDFTGGSLTGSGTVEGVATIGSGVNVAAGASPGIINFANATTFNSGSTLSFEIAGTNVDGNLPNSGLLNRGTDPATTDYDQIHVFDTATVQNGTTLTFNTIDGFSAAGGDFWDVLSADTLNIDLNNVTLDTSGIAGITPANINAAVFNLSDVDKGFNRDVLRLTVNAVQVDAIWNGDTLGNGANGNWTADNWVFSDDVSPITSPNNTSLVFFNAIIDGDKPGSSNVTLNTNATVDSLRIDNAGGDDQLTLGNSRRLTITQDPGRGGSGVVTNNGLIDINGITVQTGLIFDGNGTLLGTGTVDLSNDTDSQIAGVDGTDTLLHATGHTIQGGGIVGRDMAALNNQGTINATGTMTVGNTGTGALVNTNTGIMESSAGGNLILDDGRHINDGTIRAGDGSTVTLKSGATLVGGSGSLESVGTGVFRMNNGDNPFLEGNITNNAQVEINGITVLTGFGIQENTTLNGTGGVVMNNDLDSGIFGVDGDETLTQGANHTISGGGRLGVDLASFENQGLVDANIQSGTMQVGDDNTPEGLALANSGTLKASNGGILEFRNTRVTNNGTILADVAGTTQDSRVRLNDGTTIVGGTLQSNGSGFFQLANGDKPFLEGTITNNALFQLQGITVDTELGIGADTTLNGTGTIRMTNDANNRIVGASGAETLTQGNSHTIEGGGRVGPGLAEFENQGLVDANNGTMVLGDDTAPSSLLVDNQASGTLQASGSGTLHLTNSTLDNRGTIQALDASTVRLGDSVTIRGFAGGSFETAGTGELALSNGDTPFIQGTIVNNAELTLNAITLDTVLGISADTTLSGSGRIFLGDDTQNLIRGAVGTENLTNSAGHRIEGGGRVGIDLNQISNSGTIAGTIGGNGMQLGDDVTVEGLNLINNASGVLEGRDGGTLHLKNVRITNNGNMRAQDGSVLRLGDGTRIIGGTGTFESDGTGVIRLANGDTPVIEGTITNNAQMEMAAITLDTELGVDGLNTTLAGTGVLRMGNDSQNRILAVDGDETLTNAAGHTIEGGGRLGVDNLAILNDGTIIGNMGTMIVDPRDGTTMTNTGTLRGATGGALQLQDGNFDNQGTVEAIASGGSTNATFTSTATLQNITGGTLTGGTWRADSDGNLARVDVQGAGPIDTIAGGTTMELSGTNSSIRFNNSEIESSLASNAGTLNILGTRVFNNANALGNSGDVNVSDTGTQLNVTGNYTQTAGNTTLTNSVFSATGNYTQSGGTTTLVDATLSAASVDIQAGSTLQGTGTVTGNTTLGGTVAAGQSPGILNFANNFTLQNGGLWDLEVGGLLAGSGYDQINVTGIATLESGSNIDVSLINSFNPVLGNSFDVLTAGTITDNTTDLFSTFDFSNALLASGLQWQVDLIDDTTDTLRLSVVASGATGVITATWSPAGSGDYNTANWAFSETPVSATFPSNDGDNTFNVVIDGNGGASSDVTIRNVDPTIDHLLVDTGDSLTVGTAGNARTLTIVDTASNPSAGSAVNNGTLTIGSGSTVSIANAIQNGGTLTVGNGTLSTGTGLFNNNTVTLSGGTIQGGQVQNSDAATLQGTGTVDTTIANAGNVIAQGGTLTVNGAGIQGQSGTVQIDTGASLDLSGASGDSSADNLVHNGNDLNLGSNNFVVDVDYSNANFDSGDAFDARANVSGSGEIQAGGDVAQAITGDVSDGTTASPTLALGNVHVGDVVSKDFQVANTGATGPSLRGAIQTGANGGNITDTRLSGTGVAAGNFGPIGTGTDTGDLGVTFTATTAGALSGQVIHIENNFGNVVNQDIQVTGAAYRLAEPGAHSPEPVSLGKFREGDLAQQALSVTNTAVADGFSEGLNASIGNSTADATASGSFNLLAASAIDNSSLLVGIDTATAGAKSGTAVIEFVSNGAGTSGLGLTALTSADQTVNVSGEVYRLAEASPHSPEPVNLGNVRIGGSFGNQTLSITNTAANDGFSEGLNASFSGTGGDASASGSFNVLGAGATDSSSLSVGLGSADTSTAGLKSGTATLTFESDGSGTSGFSALALSGADQTVNVSGSVFRLADGEASPDPVVLAARVGDTAEQTLTITNNALNDGFSESLNASFGGTSGAVSSASGTVSGLVAEGSNSSGMTITMDTSSAGIKSGTATVNFESDGTGSSGLGTIAAGSQIVDLEGKVYQTASASVSGIDAGDQIDFGIVHVGDSVSRTLGVSNTATVTALNDVVTGGTSNFSGAPQFSGPQSLASVAAGSSEDLSVGLDTGSAGIFTGSMDLDLFSHNDDMSDLGILDQTLGLSAQVNNYVNPAYRKTGGDGSLSGGGNVFTLDLGDFLLGSTDTRSSTLAIINDMLGPVDLLDGAFDMGLPGDFSVTNLATMFSDLDSGEFFEVASLSFDATGLGLGTYTSTLTWDVWGHNASGYMGARESLFLNVRADIVSAGNAPVPEPETLVLLLLAGNMLILFRMRRRRSIAS